MAAPFDSLPNDNVRGSQLSDNSGEDPWASERYSLYGGSRTDDAGTTNGATGEVAAAGGAQLQFADKQLMMLSPQDAAKVAQLWAAANGMDANDAASFQKASMLPDGKTVGVGPFKLDAATIVNDWCNGMINSEGVVDRGALDNYVQQGRLSPEAADAMSTPEFMDFMKAMAQGKQPTPEEIAHFLPPDAQQCIAMDLTNAMAAGVAMQGGQLDAGSIVASLNMRMPITPQEASDPQVAQTIQSVNAQFAQIPDSIAGAQQQQQVNPNDATAQNLDPNTPYIMPGQVYTPSGPDYSTPDSAYQWNPSTVGADTGDGAYAPTTSQQGAMPADQAVPLPTEGG